MTSAQIQELADRLASILISHAAHGLATSSLKGMGEVTLRDSLIVAAAAAGAETKQAWIFQREVLPTGWTDSAVDLVLCRKGNNDTLKEVGGIELKWWRQDDKGNASNRRRDLVKDFIRAASLYKLMDEFSFVALLSTEVSWESTTNTKGADAAVMQLVGSSGSQTWRIHDLIGSTAVKQSIRKLSGKVLITNILHTKLLSTLALEYASGRSAFARIWSVKKPQKTRFLTSEEVEELIS